jgi:hypothetical protein
MQGEQDSDTADRAAHDVARLFNRPGLRNLARLARAETPRPRSRPEPVTRRVDRTMRTA